jgi:hypothetical protein
MNINCSVAVVTEYQRTGSSMPAVVPIHFPPSHDSWIPSLLPILFLFFVADNYYNLIFQPQLLRVSSRCPLPRTVWSRSTRGRQTPISSVPFVLPHASGAVVSTAKHFSAYWYLQSCFTRTLSHLSSSTAEGRSGQVMFLSYNDLKY